MAFYFAANDIFCIFAAIENDILMGAIIGRDKEIKELAELCNSGK